jgi:hypothetical protein
VPWRPTCPSVLVSSVIVHLTGPPDPCQHPFGSGMRPYPASYARRPTEGLVMCPGFLLPFGCRHSLLGSSFPRWGVGPSLRSAYRAIPGPHRDSTFRTPELRPGRVPSLPRGRRCSRGRSRVSGGRLPHPSGNVPTPRSNIHHPGLNLTRHH